MKIGNLTIENEVFLAPMAGITDKAFRQIAREYGCGLMYTEMISSKGIFYKDKKTATLMGVDEGEQPIGVQIFGHEPEIMGEIAKSAEATGAVLIDINMGCPAPKIVNNGDGCALMKDEILAGKIIESVVRSVDIPVTVKFRKGWNDDSINALRFAKIAESSGAAAVAVHGRTREQFYSGKADWDIIKKIKETLSVPVIGNGDVFSAEDAVSMKKYTGCDAVMVARGAQGNPFLFKQIKEIFEVGKVSYFPTPEEKIKCALRHIELLTEYKGEERGIKEARKHMAWYIKGMPNSSELKQKLFLATTADGMRDLLVNFLQKKC